ncbi:MAG: cation-transporting P-type ATPase, partial [Nitrospirales bacterium]|nr:cation-transporting P-type ATPase [Nitrospirales bacterium]
MANNTGKATAWHCLVEDEVAKLLDSDTQAGLTQSEVARLAAVYGPNELPQAPPASPLKLFLRQFQSIIVWVLIGAALISGLLQEWVDAAAIVAIVILNAILGFVQEFRAERSLEALKRMVVVTARVIRGGALVALPARDLAPGDLIQVEAGDHVPADARLVYAAGFRTQEASLTGEST